MQKIITKREKLIFYIAVIAVVLSIVFNFLVFPVFKKNEALNSDISITRAKLKKYLRLLAQKEFINNKYSEVLESSGISSDIREGVSVLSELENLAKVSNIKIIDMRPQNLPEGEVSRLALIDLRAEGNIEDYFKFIYKIENSFLLLKIKRLQLSVKPNVQGLEASFSIFQSSLQ